MNYTAPTPKCSNCGETLLVKNFVTDTLANCEGCGQTVSVPRSDIPHRSTDHSPSPQRNTQKF